MSRSSVIGLDAIPSSIEGILPVLHIHILLNLHVFSPNILADLHVVLIFYDILNVF